MQGTNKDKIVLTRIGGTAFIFNLEDYLRLRKDHKILGSIVGTNCVNNRVLDGNFCCFKKHSNNVRILGLPCRLTSYETQLLLEEGIAVLVDKSSIVQNPVPQEDEKMLNENLDQQLELCKEDRIKEQMHYMSKIVEGKRNKMRKMGVPEEGEASILNSWFEIS